MPQEARPQERPMTDLLAPKSAEPQPFTINKSYLRGAIWLAALAVVVLLPKPSEAAELAPPTRPSTMW